jgi:hypothetical protein
MDASYILQSLEGNTANWNMDGAWTPSFAINNNEYSMAFSTQHARSLLGSTRLGYHLLLLAATVYTSTIVEDLSAVFSDVDEVASTIETAIAVSIVNYMSTASVQTSILTCLRQANLILFEGSSGFLSYGTALSDLALSLQVQSFRLDITSGSGLNTVEFERIPLYLTLTSA